MVNALKKTNERETVILLKSFKSSMIQGSFKPVHFA
jgi:hypothetical protein